MIVRNYMPSDCQQLAELFYETVHTVNGKDYTEEQLDVWATGNVDLEEWNTSLSEHYTVVAVEGVIIVGFADMDKTGYLDRLFVHKDFQRQAIATVLCEHLEQRGDGKKITTHASITAKPFFISMGYQVIREQKVFRNGIALTNYVMEKEVVQNYISEVEKGG